MDTPVPKAWFSYVGKIPDDKGTGFCQERIGKIGSVSIPNNRHLEIVKVFMRIVKDN